MRLPFHGRGFLEGGGEIREGLHVSLLPDCCLSPLLATLSCHNGQCLSKCEPRETLLPELVPVGSFVSKKPKPPDKTNLVLKGDKKQEKKQEEPKCSLSAPPGPFHERTLQP